MRAVYRASCGVSTESPTDACTQHQGLLDTRMEAALIASHGVYRLPRSKSDSRMCDGWMDGWMSACVDGWMDGAWMKQHAKLLSFKSVWALILTTTVSLCGYISVSQAHPDTTISPPFIFFPQLCQLWWASCVNASFKSSCRSSVTPRSEFRLERFAASPRKLWVISISNYIWSSYLKLVLKLKTAPRWTQGSHMVPGMVTWYWE